MIYFFLRILAIPLAYIGWIIFELVIRRKKWAAIKGDVFAGGFFVAVATLIFYFLSR